MAVPTTVAPAWARASAMAWPMPREAPVTSATLPERSKGVSVASSHEALEAKKRRALRGERSLRKLLRHKTRYTKVFSLLKGPTRP